MSTTHPFASPIGYTPARILGQGFNGLICNCFPSTALDAARSALQIGHQSEPISSAVLSTVVALKVTNRSCVRKEVQILQTIRAHAGLHHGGKHCVQLLDYEDNTPSISWFIMATTPLCCNLEDFVAELVDPLPRPFLWLFATQLYDALWFLHRICSPPIIHGDIGRPNILISYPCGDNTGPPKISLVDFGSAEFADEGGDLDLGEISEELDVQTFCQELVVLCLESCDGVGKTPSGVDAGKIQQFLTRSKDVEDLGILWHEFVEYAGEQVEIVRQEDWGEVMALTRQAAHKVDEKRGSLSRIVQNFLQGTYQFSL